MGFQMIGMLAAVAVGSSCGGLDPIDTSDKCDDIPCARGNVMKRYMSCSHANDDGTTTTTLKFEGQSCSCTSNCASCSTQIADYCAA